MGNFTETGGSSSETMMWYVIDLHWVRDSGGESGTFSSVKQYQLCFLMEVQPGNLQLKKWMHPSHLHVEGCRVRLSSLADMWAHLSLSGQQYQYRHWWGLRLFLLWTTLFHQYLQEADLISYHLWFLLLLFQWLPLQPGQDMRLLALLESHKLGQELGGCPTQVIAYVIHKRKSFSKSTW